MAGALSHALTVSIWACPGEALVEARTHRKLPKHCHTWVQKIKETNSAYNRTAAARAKLSSLLLLPAPSHMCFQGRTLTLLFTCYSWIWGTSDWRTEGRTDRWTDWRTVMGTFTHVSMLLYGVSDFRPLVCVSFCLFVFLFNRGKPQAEGRMPGESFCHLAQPNQTSGA